MVGLFASLLAAVAVAPALGGRLERRPTPSLSNITRMNVLDTRGLEGPQFNKDFPDPSLIYGEGSWKAYSTSSGGKSVPMAFSYDAFHWKPLSNDALPDPGPWVDPRDRSIWAPDVIKNDDGLYVMYYTAHHDGGNHCIGVATSRTTTGPFKPNSRPLICDDPHGGAIDPAGFDDGRDRWLLWKVDGGSLGGATTCQGRPPSGDYYYPSPIKIQRVSRDGLTLLGQSKTILDNLGRANDGIVEAPSLYKVPGGDYVLFYSTHCFSSDKYDAEYAWSSTIDGMYGDRHTLLSSSDDLGIWGPGGLDIARNGRNVLFHGRTGPNQGAGPRYLYSATLDFVGHRIF